MKYSKLFKSAIFTKLILAPFIFCGSFLAHAEEAPSSILKLNPEYSQSVANMYRCSANKYMAVLEGRQEHLLDDFSIYLGFFGQVTAKYLHSSIKDQFMFPGSLRNIPGGMSPAGMSGKKAASSVELGKATLGVTSTLSPWGTTYVELAYSHLYPREIAARQAFTLLGNLESFPAYLALGKSYVPFGHFDSLSGIRKTLLSRYFQTLKQNATLGYHHEHLDVTFSLMRSGRRMDQASNVSFRDGANIDAMTASFVYQDTCSRGDWYVGAGWMNEGIFDYTYDAVWTAGAFPVLDQYLTTGKRNGNWDLNAGFSYDDFSFRGEYISTLRKWIAVDHKVSGVDLEGSYKFKMLNHDHRFTLGWSYMKWMSKAKAQSLLGSRSQSESNEFSATLVSMLHKFVSAYLRWDHYKGPNAVPSWMFHGDWPRVSPVRFAVNNSKALTNDQVKVGVQFTY